MSDRTYGVVRIGRGTKLHPAYRETDNGRSTLTACCSCAGVINGNARSRMTFYPNMQSTCGPKRSKPPVPKGRECKFCDGSGIDTDPVTGRKRPSIGLCQPCRGTGWNDATGK